MNAAIFNPQNKPLEELPVIYGFNNGGSPGWLDAVAIAQDGTILGSHICSNESWIQIDLGVLEGYRTDRHENSYRKHYPDGYRMEFVPGEAITDHTGLQRAFSLHQMEEAAIADDNAHGEGEDSTSTLGLEPLGGGAQ